MAKSDATSLMVDIRSFRDQVAARWHDVDELALTDKERASLRLHLTLLADDLVSLLKRLNQADGALN